jgi:formylglycine-generating enzyme required for sulfatase activity
VRDARTGLTWLSADNQQDVNWAEAKAFCERSTAGGRSDWRLPTVAELENLFDRQSQNSQKILYGIAISGWCVWSSESASGGKARYFTFMSGEPGAADTTAKEYQRALCVAG